MHVPAVPVAEHVEHEPTQAELQHTPSTQKPLAHASLPTHGCPFAGSARHVPMGEHVKPVAQSSFAVHCVRHAVEPH